MLLIRDNDYLQDHQKAAEAVELRQQMTTAKETSFSKSEGAIRCAMANVLFLAKEDLPSSMVPAFNNFLMYQGVSKLASLRVDSHTTYEHSSSIDAFQDALSSVIEEELLCKIRDSVKFSLMLDESTDISIHQNLIVYIRVLECNHVDIVEPQTYFLGIDSLYRANAESIFIKLTCMLEQKGIDIVKLCGVSTDGASVMVGSKSGVVTRIKKEVPGVLATHCIAHRLALSCCSGADCIPYLVKVQEILNSIYKYFHNSPKNTAMLEAIQTITPGQSGKFKEVFHTRWLSFHGSVEACIMNFSSVVAVFLEEKSGKSLSLYKPITTYKFLYVLHFMADVLQPLAILSKSFQTKDIDFAEVNPLLATAVQTIEKVSEGKCGPRLVQFLKQVPEEPKTGDDGLETFEFHGHTIRDANKQRREAVSICESFSAGVVRSMHDRFADNDDAAILTAMSNIFNPVVQKTDKASDVVVASEYLCSLGYENCREDLELFLSFMHSLVDSGSKVVKHTKDVANLAMKKKDLYPAAAEAAERMLVAPVSTVDCERGFSKQNLVKTCLRNKLSVGRLDKLMRISLDTRRVADFPFDKAFKKWAGVKSRRILD
ncbi:E3 SUMO-protein ligase KIAA1586-like [Mya arenaria]|nr:E3 SUMO-protein ligase KIAA1586-like [Mya arenaria]